MTIPYSTQTIDQADIDAVDRVLRSDFLTQGPVTPLFEQTVANYCNSDFAVAFNSATSALHSACLSLGVEKGDLVWTTAISFVATANCATLCGAEVEFVDIDPKTINMSLDDLELRLEHAEQHGRLPKVVIPVHFAGNPVDMRTLGRLKEKYNFLIIEDASHALGATQHGEPVGNCKYSEITVFSFHAVKIITTGEGGMAVTNSESLKNQLQLIRSHGVTRDDDYMHVKYRGSWYYEQVGIGFNYRLSEIHAALGLSQMKKIDDFNRLRRKSADAYVELLINSGATPIKIDKHNVSSHHLLVARLDAQVTAEEFELIFSGMRAENILVNHHYIPIYRHPFYRHKDDGNNCPEAEKYFMNALSLPLFPNIRKEQIEQTTDALKKVIEKCLR